MTKRQPVWRGGWRWKADMMRKEAQRCLESGNLERAKEFSEAAIAADEIAVQEGKKRKKRPVPFIDGL